MSGYRVEIGHLSWDACDECAKSDYYAGCTEEPKYHGFWPVTVEGDSVYCDLFVAKADAMEVEK